MRIMVFFDLPTITLDDKREYRKFRKFLIKAGFIMIQESVYSKLVLNSTVANILIDNVRKHKPTSGLVQLLMITEKQYGKMEFIVGEKHSDVVDSAERVIVI